MLSVSRSTWIAIGGFAALIGGFVVFGLVPHLMTTMRLEREIREYRAQMEQSEQQSNEVRELSNQAIHMAKEVRNYPRLVPGNKDLGLFLGQLSHELDAAGMTDTTVRNLPPTVLGKTSQLPFEIHSSGSYEQFHDFLQRVENLPRMSSISKLEVKADDGMSGKVTVDMTLSIYSTHEN